MREAISFDDSSTVTPGVGVPMLDWPSDLFCDEASAADLADVDVHCRCEPFDFVPVPVAAAYQIAA